jgi:hypothetical protein
MLRYIYTGKYGGLRGLSISERTFNSNTLKIHWHIYLPYKAAAQAALFTHDSFHGFPDPRKSAGYLKKELKMQILILSPFLPPMAAHHQQNPYLPLAKLSLRRLPHLHSSRPSPQKIPCLAPLPSFSNPLLLKNVCRSRYPVTTIDPAGRRSGNNPSRSV